jgi:hypothetical protein
VPNLGHETRILLSSLSIAGLTFRDRNHGGCVINVASSRVPETPAWIPRGYSLHCTVADCRPLIAHEKTDTRRRRNRLINDPCHFRPEETLWVGTNRGLRSNVRQLRLSPLNTAHTTHYKRWASKAQAPPKWYNVVPRPREGNMAQCTAGVC